MDVFGGGEATTNNHWKIHHYCYAQLHFMRANRAGAKPMQVKEHLSATVEEIDFTIEKVTPDFILLPEMLLYRGRALLRLGKEGEALASWEQAIKLKADYWPPYMEIANLRVRAGDRGKAAEVLRVAIERSPGAKPVQERLRELESNR
jgi:tetratricopeptide (TPR) repeat protein